MSDASYPIQTEGVGYLLNDPVLHIVHPYNFSAVDQSFRNIAQPVKGQRTRVDEPQSVQSRFPHATCDAGHPRMSAYIVRADHPYCALRNAKGEFKLTNVLPGTYKLTMWHEGVHVVKTMMEKGAVSEYYYEELYAESRDIVVSSKGIVRADFTLALRKTK